jgi:hypothetical protein
VFDFFSFLSREKREREGEIYRRKTLSITNHSYLVFSPLFFPSSQKKIIITIVLKQVGTDEDGEPLIDFFSAIYVPMPLAEKLKDLEIQQAERLAELPALARDFDAAFEAAAGAGSGFVDEANRAAARSPRAIE